MVKTVRVPDYSPSERQTKFHQSAAFETMYGGAAGGGKTAALVGEAITYALEHPKARVYMFRKTIPEIKQSIVPEFYKQMADYINIARGVSYNSQDRVFTFNNGSIIQLAYLENDADMYRYQSAEIHLLMIDELTHFTQDQYDYLKTRVRSTGEFPLKVMSATNPGNIGHAWVKHYFIDIAPPETIYTDKHGNTRQFIPAKVSDHPSEAFRKTYSQQLASLSDPNVRRALLDGDWDIFAGQAFEEWRRDTEDGKPYHVVAPFAIPSHWTRWFAYDWGYNSFAAGVWLTKDPSTERIYLYREFYEHAMTASKQAETIYMMDNEERMSMRLADPSLWKQIGNAETGETVAAIFQRNSLIFQPANNDRKAGKNAVHEALAPQADGLPKLQVFSSCVNFIRTFPNLPIDPNRVEDVVTKDVEDHCFTGETLIKTKRGDISIKEIVVGDYVWSPLGWNEVFECGSSGKQTIKDYGVFRATPDHKVITNNGVLPLDTLGYSDKILVCTAKKLSLMDICIDAILNPNIAQIDFIFRGLLTKMVKAVGLFYTEKYGNSIMGIFLKATTYITKTTMLVTMTLAILSAWSIKHILNFIATIFVRMPKSILKSCKNWLKHGIKVKKVGSGTQNMPRSSGRINQSINSTAKFVEKSMKRHFLVEANTVIKTVKQKPLGKEEVYNLTTKYGFFYANGVLVANCYDALRYGLMNQRPAKAAKMKLNTEVINRRQKYR